MGILVAVIDEVQEGLIAQPRVVRAEGGISISEPPYPMIAVHRESQEVVGIVLAGVA